MMKQFKKALVLVFGVLCVLALTACHGNKTKVAFEVPESFDTETPIEITFWAKNDTNLAQVAVYNRAVEEFQKLYPNVTVTLRLYTDYTRLYNDVITNISTNTTPNVCITYPDHVATYLTGAETVVALDELLMDERFGLGGTKVPFEAPAFSEMVPKFLEEGKLGGHYYAMPFMRSTEACYVNKTYVEKLGYTLPEVLTWDFIWEVSDAAMAKDDDGVFTVNGQQVMIPFIYKSTDNMMIQYLEQCGADYSTGYGDILMFNDTTTDFLKEIAEHVKKGSFSTFKISSYPANFLNAGQCIFAIDSTAGATWMGPKAPLADICMDDFVDYEIAVLPIPQVDTQNLKMISQGPSVCLFNKENPQEVLASWLFVQYLLTNDIQMGYAMTEGYTPVTQKAWDSEAYRDYLSRSGEDNDTYYSVKIDATKLLLNHIDETFVTPVFNGSASLRNAAGQVIESTTLSIRRKQTVDDAYFTNLYDEMTALYHLDQGAGVSGDRDLGPLPKTAVALICAVAALWILMGAYVLWQYLKQKRKGKSHKK